MEPERDDSGRWLPGHSPNPSGRPRGSVSITAALKRELEREIEGRTCAERIAARLVELALEGNLRAIQECLTRCDGMPIRADGVEEGPVQFAPITIRRVERIGPEN